MRDGRGPPRADLATAQQDAGTVPPRPGRAPSPSVSSVTSLGGDGFSRRVAVMFVAQVATAGLGFVNAFLFARLLGPAAKGDYYLLLLPPNTLVVLAQLGLPAAFAFYAARGQTLRMGRMALVLAAALSLVALACTFAALPLLSETVLRGLDPTLIVTALSAFPLLLVSTLMTDILIGRGAVAWFARVAVAQSLVVCVLLVVAIGILGLGVAGAVGTFVVGAIVGTVGFTVGAFRAARTTPEPAPVTYRQLVRFGLPLYPGSLTLFFGYRADVYLLAWLLADPSAPLGFYSMAVTLAEMVFFLPNAVAALFFPRVSGSVREEADRQVPVVSRLTLLVTAGAGLALAPAATVLVLFLLPAFTPALPALYLLLPGVVALSVSKVVSGYVAGVGHTTLTSIVQVSAFALNVVVNLLLIPRFGILGAATASLVSYVASSMAFTVLAARLAGAPTLAFWLPRPADVRLALSSVVTLVRTVASRVTARADLRG